MKLTEKELAEMPEKQKRDPEAVELYMQHEFLTAYALHTARRIEKTGYQAAIGGGDNWDEHGNLQRDFLVSQGLKSHSTLLEIGCGTGRLARKVVPCLHPDSYVGVDISSAALDVARGLSVSEGWASHRPTFLGEIPTGRFDFAWAFSVFIHLPQDIMEDVMTRVASVMHKDSKFFWAYVPEPKTYRSGVKQFRHTLEDYKRAAKNSGLTFDDVPEWIAKAGYTQGRWSGNQRVAVSRTS